MKNLVLLTETRHSTPTPNKSNSGGRSSSDYIQALVPNPNADHDLLQTEGGIVCAADDTGMAFHFILTSSGILKALDALDGELWSLDLTALFIDDPEEQQQQEGDDDKAGDDTDIIVGERVIPSKTNWFHLSYNEATDRLVTLSHSGAIVSIDPNWTRNDDEDCNELIGSFDYGIECAAWSTDGEILALTTYQQEEIIPTDDDDNNDDVVMDSMTIVPVLMTMNTTFEILAEVTLPNHTPTESISLTWNQKSTTPLLAITSHDSQDDTRRIRIFHLNDETQLEFSSMGRSEDGSGKLIPNLVNTSDINGETSSSSSSGLAWAGDNCSNLLACIQRKGKKGRNVVFIEPNGLQHGGFKLAHVKPMAAVDQGEEVVGIDFNTESDLLGITVLNKSNLSGKVQLYHRCNYHWYLKYEIQYDVGVSVASLSFDLVKGYDLSIALKRHSNYQGEKGQLEWRHYQFIWDPSTTSLSTGMATVVDGNLLNITMLEKAIVPPPMFASQLVFDEPIIGLAHVPPSLQKSSLASGISLAVYLNDGRIVLCGGGDVNDKGRVKDPTIVTTVDLKMELQNWSKSIGQDLDVSCVRQILVVDFQVFENKVSMTFLAAKCVSIVTGQANSFAEDALCFTVDLHSSGEVASYESAKIVDVSCTKLEGKVLRMANWSNSAAVDGDDSVPYPLSGPAGAIIELTNGALFEFSLSKDGEGMVVPCDSEPMLMEPCPWLSAITFSTDRRLVAGLSPRFRLYCGERLLCNASSSFVLSPSHRFLSYVTLGSRSQLRFLPLDVLMQYDPFMGSDDNMDVLGEGYEPRMVERGARLVSIHQKKPTVVLQLPRGNLEAVYPRALVLPHIMKLIDSEEYHLALDMMRRQRVDTNLLVDLDIHRFLESGTKQLIKQVKRNDHLNLFIACLQDIDITVFKYVRPSWYGSNESKEENKPSNLTFDFSTKVNQVCSNMRAAMLEMENNDSVDDGHFLLPVLSTFAKENPPQLEKALALIKTNADTNTSAPSGRKTKKTGLLSESAQSSIQYLAFLADYELLFDTALGMYDFDLAKAVARNSQMDPKVYLPMLKRLRGLPEFVGKFEVDLKLKRFDSALTHLFKSGLEEEDGLITSYGDEGHFDKCLQFIEEHKLHRQGLKLFNRTSDWYRRVLISLGEHLLKENKGDLAMSMFLSANPRFIDGAMRAARSCGDWKTYFSLLPVDGDPEEIRKERKSLGAEVAEIVASGKGAVNSKRDNFSAAARILIDYCQDIDGAIDKLISAQMWFEARRQAILQNREDLLEHIIEAASTYSYTCVDDFNTRAEEFEKTNSRYATVVEIRKQAKRDGEDGDVDNHDETGSLFSMASTATNASVRSNMSASSVGSVSTVSSVISAGAVSNFSLVGGDEMKHKSKYNRLGKMKKKKKRKPTRRERKGEKPGSEEELKTLVGTLKSNIIDDEYASILRETIQFLAQVEMLKDAKDLYEATQFLKKQVELTQTKRIEEVRRKREDEEIKARKEGQHYENITLECEEEIDQLRCSDLPDVIHDMFSYLV